MDYRLTDSVHGISRQEYWSGLPCPTPGHFPDPGIEPASLTFPAFTARFFTTSATREAHASKFGKLSSGYRTEKDQFSFQSQRKAMSKNAQTTAQLDSTHTLVK